MLLLSWIKSWLHSNNSARVGKYCDLCVLQDLVIEAVFPQSGISRIMDSWVKWNKLTMTELEDGRQYRGDGHMGSLVCGSRGERLAMEDKWGHPDADLDGMLLRGGPFGVYTEGGQQPRGKSCLDFCLEGCPVAYCKLEVTDLNGLRESTVTGNRWCDNNCTDEYDGRHCMNTYHVVRKLKDAHDYTSDNPTVTGPAAQSRDNIETVQTLVCSGPYPDLQEFESRPRGSWPPVTLIKYILQTPILLVLVGHKGSPESDSKQQARISWSHLELKLILELPESVHQGYIACKYVMKRFLEARRGQNEAVYGRSKVCSYHLKIAFLHFLEKSPPSQITSPFGLFLDLLHELDEYLKMGKLPHYFLAECNLLETVADDERGIARQVITTILSDPLNALLSSPTCPQEIYGEVCPNELVVAFVRVSSRPTRDACQNLSVQLARVDKRRRQKWEEQEDWDLRRRVLGRPEPIALVDMLKEIRLNIV